jgi:hypothetical protein
MPWGLVSSHMAGSDDVAASLIASLTDEGEAVDEGSFTLDPAKAREKLREYQLVDAHEWILLAISAGHVATGGRGPVRVEWGSTATVWFPGVSLTAEQLGSCFAAVFGRERGLEGEARKEARVLRLLGIAGNAALSLGSELAIESVVPGGERHVLRVGTDGVQRIEHDRSDGAEVGIRVIVRGGRGQRRAALEYELVLDRCRMAAMAISMDTARISQGPIACFDKPLQRVDVRVGDIVVGEAAFESVGVDPAKALIINRGVLVATETLANCSAGFVAVVYVDLPMDLSQRQILRDKAWDELMAAIQTAHDGLPRPRPRVVDVGRPATHDEPPPWRHAVVVIGAVLVLGTAIVIWLGSEEPPREQLRHACEVGDRDACATLIELSQ